MICRVLIAKEAYNIITGVKLRPPGNGITLRTLSEDCHDRANKAIALIPLGCCDELLPLIDNINDPVEMWEAFSDGAQQCCNKTRSYPSPAKVHRVSTIARRNRHTVLYQTNRLPQGADWHHQNLTDDVMKRLIFTTLSDSYETTILILQQRIPASTAK